MNITRRSVASLAIVIPALVTTALWVSSDAAASGSTAYTQKQKKQAQPKAKPKAKKTAPPESPIKRALKHRILDPNQTMREVQAFVPPKIRPVPRFSNVADWEQFANRVRQLVLDRVVLVGEAKRWAEAKTKVEWLETIPGGEGYKIRKLRFEAVPGLWIPALLYLPDKLEGKVPAVLNVNGHDGKGKNAPYKQIRCINQAKRGIIALNTDWVGLGQLRSSGFAHARMNQIDLCGTSGLAVFYLTLKRALDLLLQVPHVDPDRVAVTGLSGGGWQTIVISSLDTRVKLANPVAGYASFLTRTYHLADLGDSEQTPTDLGTIADYTTLTALVAPRPLLLTYNAKDQCCFQSDRTLGSLLNAAMPIYGLYGHPERLRYHVNYDPGTHNYERENREQFYRMLGDFFFKGKKFDPKEIPCQDEVKDAKQLEVPLPKDNLDMHKIALKLCRNLPREPELPGKRPDALAWQKRQRKALAGIVRWPGYKVTAAKLIDQQEVAGSKPGTKIKRWVLTVDGAWSVPVVELCATDKPEGTVIMVSEKGRGELAALAEKALAARKRVFVCDVFYFGDCHIPKRNWLFAILIATVGERPLGVQASQLAAVARWAADRSGGLPAVTAKGPRSSLIALVSAAIEPEAFKSLQLHNSFASLKEVIERDIDAVRMPEVFCFGLLEKFDIKQLVALVAPRPVKFVSPTDRTKQELKSLQTWYSLLGTEYNPVSDK